MATIQFINKSLFTVKASEFIKDGVVSTNIDIKSVPTSEGKTKNVCRIGVFENHVDEVNTVEDAINIIGQCNVFAHKNKLIEKYKNVVTSISVSDASSSVYYIMAIPYNGNIDAINVASSDESAVELINATTLKTESFSMSEKSKLKFAKILYMIIHCDSADADVTVNFVCESHPKTDDGMKVVVRELSLTVKSTGNDEDRIPDVINVESTDAVANEDGTYNISSTKFGDFIKSHSEKQTETAAPTNSFTISAEKTYSIPYSAVIKEKRDNDNRHERSFKSNGSNGAKFLMGDKFNNARDKSNAHKKSINKLNKAKGKFAE